MQKPKLDDLVPVEGQILTGSLFSEPVRVATVRLTGPGTWVLGVVGIGSERYRSVTLTAAELSTLRFTEQAFTYAGDAQLLRLGLQAYALEVKKIEHYQLPVNALRSQAGGVTGP